MIPGLAEKLARRRQKEETVGVGESGPSNESIEDQSARSSQGTGSIHSPGGGIKVVVPGLAEKLAQRRMQNGELSERSEEKLVVGNYIGSPSSSSHEEGGVSFDQVLQILAFLFMKGMGVYRMLSSCL